MEPDLAAMTEEEQIAYAMRMSMAEGKEDGKVGRAEGSEEKSTKCTNPHDSLRIKVGSDSVFLLTCTDPYNVYRISGNLDNPIQPY